LRFITTQRGQQLGVVVTLPADENGVPIDDKFPTVLVQSGYNIIEMPTPGLSLVGSPDQFIVRRGYVQVSVDVLGTGVSQGGWELFGEDEQAAYSDTVDWVQQQRWYNGKLGVAGLSYMAISALFTAERRPDAVDAVFAMLPTGDAMRGTFATGGLINMLFLTAIERLVHTRSLQNQATILQNWRNREYFRAVNEEHIEQIDRFYLPLAEDALNGAPYITYDSEFWRTRSPLERVDQIRAPTFITGALHDISQRDQPLLFERLRQNVDSRLVVYDGTHTTNLVQAITGAEAVAPILSLYLQWFDHYLKDMDTGLEGVPAVTQYVKNYGQLRNVEGRPWQQRWSGFSSATSWPHPQASAERWFLRGNMTLSRTQPAQIEATHSVAKPDEYELTIGSSRDGRRLVADLALNDDTDCSISYGQWTLGLVDPRLRRACTDESNAVEANALNYESAPMANNYYINGPVQADIWIESSATDAVVSVRLDEVSPDGVVHPLSNGLLLASNRAVDESRSRFITGEMVQPFHYLTEDHVLPVVPGEVIKVSVEVFPTSAIILRGHRLRISIAASNQAQGVLNRPRQQQMAGSSITVHNSPQYPSSVVLPIVPMSALN
jgi:uncharacterized protein